MNVGNSLVISPALVTKYLDATKEIAKHAVLLRRPPACVTRNLIRDHRMFTAAAQ